MSNINSKDLYSIELVQDLDHEAAATVSGGALYLWNAPQAAGEVEVLAAADPDLEEAPGAEDLNNEASYFKVTGPRSWYAYTGKNYTGRRYTLKAGTQGKLTGGANNTLSSARPAPAGV